MVTVVQVGGSHMLHSHRVAPIDVELMDILLHPTER